MERKRKWTDEDLRELLQYIASNPAFAFPELSEEDRKELLKEIQEEMLLAQDSDKLLQKSERVAIVTKHLRQSIKR